MLIDLLDIANALDKHSQEVIFNLEDGTYDLFQRATGEEDPEHLMEGLDFKHVAMYATGLVTSQFAEAETDSV